MIAYSSTTVPVVEDCCVGLRLYVCFVLTSVFLYDFDCLVLFDSFVDSRSSHSLFLSKPSSFFFSLRSLQCRQRYIGDLPRTLKSDSNMELVVLLAMASHITNFFTSTDGIEPATSHLPDDRSTKLDDLTQDSEK
jgi:hypothetical protein